MRQTEIHLTEEDRMALKAFCSRGQHRAREINRAHEACFCSVHRPAGRKGLCRNTEDSFGDGQSGHVFPYEF